MFLFMKKKAQQFSIFSCYSYYYTIYSVLNDKIAILQSLLN